MNTKKPKNVNGRWIKGPRYDEKTAEYIREHYTEKSGWFRGARVWRK